MLQYTNDHWEETKETTHLPKRVEPGRDPGWRLGFQGTTVSCPPPVWLWGKLKEYRNLCSKPSDVSELLAVLLFPTTVAIRYDFAPRLKLSLSKLLYMSPETSAELDATTMLQSLHPPVSFTEACLNLREGVSCRCRCCCGCGCGCGCGLLLLFFFFFFFFVFVVVVVMERRTYAAFSALFWFGSGWFRDAPHFCGFNLILA